MQGRLTGCKEMLSQYELAQEVFNSKWRILLVPYTARGGNGTGDDVTARWQSKPVHLTALSVPLRTPSGRILLVQCVTFYTENGSNEFHQSLETTLAPDYVSDTKSIQAGFGLYTVYPEALGLRKPISR